MTGSECTSDSSCVLKPINKYFFFFFYYLRLSEALHKTIHSYFTGVITRATDTQGRETKIFGNDEHAG